MRALPVASVAVLATFGLFAYASQATRAGAPAPAASGLEIRWLKNATYDRNDAQRYLITIRPVAGGRQYEQFLDRRTGCRFGDDATIKAGLTTIFAADNRRPGAERTLLPHPLAEYEPPGASTYLTTDQRTAVRALNLELKELRGMVAASPLVVGEGDILPNAAAGVDKATGRLYQTIKINFTSAGQRKMTDFTSSHRHPILATILDGRVLSTPTVMEPLTTGPLEIAGGFPTATDAQSAAREINAGAIARSQ